MKFEELLDNVSPKINVIAQGWNGYGPLMEADDLFQEACIHLWTNYKDGLPEGINEAYALKGCKFHLLNYYRKNREKEEFVSLEEHLNGENIALKEILPAGNENTDHYVDRKTIMEGMNSGNLTERERKILSLLAAGCTVREIGKKLGISHVLVVRLKRKMIEKYRKTGKIKVTK